MSYAEHTEQMASLRASRIAELEAKVARLTAALKPFADCATVFDPGVIGGTMPKTGSWQSWPRMIDGKYHSFDLTVEHLREARDAVKEVEG